MHDENSAPPEATALTQAKKQLGFIPNLYGVLAESPQALAAYLAVSDQVRKSSLSTAAQQVVLLTASRHNGCSYLRRGVVPGRVIGLCLRIKR